MRQSIVICDFSFPEIPDGTSPVSGEYLSSKSPGARLTRSSDVFSELGEIGPPTRRVPRLGELTMIVFHLDCY